MTSEDYAAYTRGMILDNTTSQDPQYYGAYSETLLDHGTSHLSVLSANGDAASITGTVNT